ncbi:ATP-binding protein [Candidatus Saccharibacteria bacterium]|nr:ATP-binding protein [Candidatus Saccharibacteria bacterium]
MSSAIVDVSKPAGPKRVFLEGLPGAGKSTLCRRLQERDGVNYVPEVYDTGAIEIAKDYIIPSTASSALARAIEFERGRHVDHDAVFDRSFLTWLVLAGAIHIEDRPDVFEESVETIGKAIDDRRILLPSAIVYLEADPATSLARQSSRGAGATSEPGMEIFSDIKTLQRLRVADRAILDSCCDIPLLVIDGRLPTEAAADSVLGVMSTEHDTTASKINLDLYAQKMFSVRRQW